MKLFGHRLDRGALFLAAAVGVLGVVASRTWATAAQGSEGTTSPVVIQRSLPTPPAIATADSNRTMIAVTGIDLTGSSILYLVDTENRQLAVYQASGGADSMQGVKLVGARKIDLDLKLEGFNDKSQYSYEDLERKFAENNRAPGAAPKKP